VLVDPDNGDLWIADARLPLVHHFAVTDAGASPLPALNVGVPVTDLALTPLVPAELGATAESAPARYLYAIDALGGDVLAIDLLPSSASFGAVLPVNAGLDTPDRIHFPARARTLAVLQPEPAGVVCSIGSDQDSLASPDRLRGVFLAVGLADGSARIVDVYDLDATCRGGDGDCMSPSNSLDLSVYIRRHAPRIGTLLSVPVGLATSPSFSFESSPGVLDDTGAEQTRSGPGLLIQDACPDHMTSVWPSASQAALAPVICASTDAWELPAERWSAGWEASLPRTGGAGELSRELDGRAGAWLRSLAGEICARGVLGAEDVAALGPDDPQASYGGDELVITSELPLASLDLAECEAFVTPTDGSERPLVAFTIEAAADDRLRLGDALGDYTFDDISSCFSGVLRYEVRTHGVYAVVGSTTGFVHRLAADSSGRCVPDPELPVDPLDPRTYRVGRAMPRVLFDNGFVSFEIQHDDVSMGLAPDARATLVFTLSRIPPGLGVSLRSAEGAGASAAIVDELVWNSTDQSLFGVDGQGNRLVQLKADPFRVVRALR